MFITKPETPGEITASLAWKDRVFAAWSSGGGGDDGLANPSHGVWVFQRGKRVAQLEDPGAGRLRKPIVRLLAFGSWIVGCGFDRLEVWNSRTYESHTTILATTRVSGKTDDGFTGEVCSMPTLLNKICVGKRDGCVELWNIATR